MAFLLTDGCAPFQQESGWLEDYRLAHAGSQTIREGSATLLVTGSTGLYRHDAAHDGGFFPRKTWVAFEGFLTRPASVATFKPETAASSVFRLLQKHNSFEPLGRLKGNFSLLIASPDRKQYVLLRDSLGARSGFYARKQNTLALSNRSHLIAGLNEFALQPDPAFMAHMFALRKGTPLERSPFAGVTELRPGERISFMDGKSSSTPRDLDLFDSESSFSNSDWVQRFHDTFSHAVDEVVDVEDPPFVMLSGGLDSGPIAAIAHKKLSSHGKALRAISWRLRLFPNCDESIYVEDIASHLGIKLHTFDADHLLPFSSFDGRLMPLDFPIPNLFRGLILATYEAGRELGHHVFLNGNAGDFLYPQKEWLLTDQIRRLELRGAMHTFASQLKTHGFFGIRDSASLRYLAIRALKRQQRNPSLPIWMTARAGVCLDRQASADRLNPTLDFSARFSGTFIGQGTANENGIAAEYGLQRRDPFVNEELIKLALKIPFSLSWRDGTSKWIMREAMKLKPYLPESIRTKPRTGLLLDFYNAGFEANRSKIEDFLFREHREWQEWIEPTLIKRALSGDPNAEKGRTLAGIAVGYSIWRREIARLPTINPS